MHDRQEARPRPADGPVEILQVRVGELCPASDNPRRHRGDLAELVSSIRSVGILQPLVVSPEPGPGYRIVCGERRWAAAVELGLPTVPCVVRRFTEQERQEAMLIENLQRQNLSPLEEAEAFQRLIALGHSQRQIAERVGKSQGYVSRRLLLLALPAATQEQVERHELPLDQALGYRSAPAEDVFAADEQLQQTWRALRQQVLEGGDRRLIRLMREFSTAYVRWMGIRTESRPGDASHARAS